MGTHCQLQAFTMVMFAKSLFAACAALAIHGCSSPAPVEGSTANEPAATKVAMETCGFCGESFPKAELISHDGKMICKACNAAHSH
jgi:formylmethanofuran dehydrogenase subunit E